MLFSNTSLFTGNILLGLYCALVILCIVVAVLGIMVMMGWKLGILEAIILVMVPGLSVDYCAHLAEGYRASIHPSRRSRVRDMLTTVAVSVLSGAVSTMGSSAFLLGPLITFFPKFGTGILLTAANSIVLSIFVFSACMSIFGPEGNQGNLFWLCRPRSSVQVGAE